MKQTGIMEITLNEAEEVFENYTGIEDFVDNHFQQRLGGHNEYWDNSIELAEYWTKCNQIINSQ